MTELELGPLKFGIIGAGRLGCAVGRALQQRGFEVVHASSRTSEGRDQATRLLEVPVHEDLLNVTEAVDCVIVCVPDDALGDVIRQLTGRAADTSPIQLRIVTMSSHGGVTRLAPLAAAGHLVGVLHPVASITDDAADPSQLTGGGAAVGADDEAMRTFLHAFAHVLDLVPFDMPEASWPIHATACTIIANGVASLLAAVEDLAAEAGLHAGVAQSVYGRLAATGIERALRVGPVQSLAGPIVRGDAAAIATQVLAARASTSEVDALFIPVVATMANRAFTSGRIDMQTHRNLLEAILDPSQFDEDGPRPLGEIGGGAS
ncbi:MAG: DUF2520 domain-containing protein [Gaiellales bacterium]